MIPEQALSCTVQPGMPYGAHGDIGGRWASGIGRAERGTIKSRARAERDIVLVDVVVQLLLLLLRCFACFQVACWFF